MAQGIILHGALATPVNAAFSQTDTGGVLPPSTTYFYRVSALDGGGETLASSSTSGATSATAGNTHAMVVNWTAVPGATGYKVYGRSSGTELLIATVGNVTTYTDTGSITPAGTLPAANTTGKHEATSTVVTLASGATGTIALAVASGNIPRDAVADVVMTATGFADVPVAQLSHGQAVVQVAGPGVFKVTRRACSAAVAVVADPNV